MDQIDIVPPHAAAPRMPSLLAAGCVAAVWLDTVWIAAKISRCSFIKPH